MGLIQTDAFISKLLSTNDYDIDQICIDEKNYINNSFLTIGSRKYAFSIYRKAVELNCSQKLFNKVCSHFKLTVLEYDQYKKAYKASVKYDHDSLKPIYDYQSYIAKAESLIESSKFNENVLGFAALSGRRVAEIACTAKFEYDQKNHFLFTGQLKTRGSSLFDAYVIPCLTDTIKFFEAFKQFRLNFNKYLNEPRKFNANCSKDLGIVVRKHFSSFVEGDITPKDLRAIYTTIACAKFKVKSQTQQSYIANVLGHGNDDLETCNSYFDYYLL